MINKCYECDTKKCLCKICKNNKCKWLESEKCYPTVECYMYAPILPDTIVRELLRSKELP